MYLHHRTYIERIIEQAGNCLYRLYLGRVDFFNEDSRVRPLQRLPCKKCN